MKNSEQKLITVCIPTYEMHGLGHGFLRESLEILTQQTFKDFNVVISDFSKDDLVKKVCDEFLLKLDISYFKNTDTIVGMATNANNAMRHATGKIIKLLLQDDFLYSKDSLALIAKNFDLEKDRWMVTGCEHSRDGVHFYRKFFPTYNDKIHLGNNTISSPSVLVLKNEDLLFFDKNLKIYVDVDYYKQYYDKFGLPKILNKIIIVNRTGEHQLSNTLEKTIRENEYDYVLKKYNAKTPSHDVTVVAVSGINPTSAMKALEYSIDGMKFKEALLISHKRPEKLDERITFKQCLPTELASKNPKDTSDYSKFIAYQLAKYIDTDYALIVHKDAYVLRPEKWEDEFFKYDYIGAPWKKGAHFTNEGVNIRVGNGGFSFRSKKLLNILNELNLPFTDNGTGYFNEDGIICGYYRKTLEEHGIRFAPPEVAARFSTEKICNESVADPFGFHDNKDVIPRFFFVRFFLHKMKRTAKKLFKKHVGN